MLVFNLIVIGKTKLGFIQFVKQCVFADIQGKTKHSDRKRVYLMNMHCWAGLKLVETKTIFVWVLQTDEAQGR